MSTNLLQNPSVHGPSRQIQGLRLGFGLGGLDRAFGTSGFPHLDGARVQWFAWIRENKILLKLKVKWTLEVN